LRILVIRRAAIGDTIITLPTLEILREHYPDAFIEVIGNSKYWEIALNRYHIDAVTNGEAKLTPELYSKSGRITREVADHFSSFDLILAYINDTEGFVKENLIKIGVEQIVFYPPFPADDDLHATDYTALILRKINLAVNTPLFPKVYLSREDLDFASQFLSPFMKYKPLVAIHPRTYGIKGWTIEKFINIGKWIENEIGGKSIWIMGPAEDDNFELFKSKFPSSPILHLQSLSNVASILRSSHLYFGCDTGISHLAAAVGVTVIVLFGPTNPKVWGPRGKDVCIIKSNDILKIQEDEVKNVILRYNSNY
jgi:ADP-heptose:LPS heptosyltransferase